MKKCTVAIVILLMASIDCSISNAQSKGTEQRDSTMNQNRVFTNSIGVEFVLVPAGSFMMGSVIGHGRTDEQPQHEVVISKPFYISKYPITVGQFRQFISATGYRTEAEKGDGAFVWTYKKKWEQKSDANWKDPYFDQTEKNPVVCITWNDAKAFVDWLGAKDGRRYALPSEAQFEYACRAATTSQYFFESDTLKYSSYGWPQELTSQGYPTHPVGMKSLIRGDYTIWWGMHGSGAMIGTMKILCNKLDLDPMGPKAGDYKVNRGGMGPDSTDWSSTRRDALTPDSHYSNQSFRLVIN